LNTCTKCGFTAKCGCVFERVDGELVCKKCVAKAKGEELAADLKVEMEVSEEGKVELSKICNGSGTTLKCRICGIEKTCGICFVAESIQSYDSQGKRIAVCKLCQTKFEGLPKSSIPIDVLRALEPVEKKLKSLI
jgi:hypothetical protein